MERTGLALVKLVYLVLRTHKYEVRLKVLICNAGPFYRHPDLEHILSTSARSVLWVGEWMGQRNGPASTGEGVPRPAGKLLFRVMEHFSGHLGVRRGVP